jgi:hypothetical protein
MKYRSRSAGFDFSPPFSKTRLEQGLRLVEDSFGEQRQRAEDLTREIIAGTVTPDRWSEAVREASQQAWKTYATWWSLISRPPGSDEDADERNSDEKDE